MISQRCGREQLNLQGDPAKFHSVVVLQNLIRTAASRPGDLLRLPTRCSRAGGQHLCPLEQPAGEEAVVASHDPLVLINQVPNVKAERLDASRNLSNLSRIVDARFHRIERQIRERHADARENWPAAILAGVALGIPGFP